MAILLPDNTLILHIPRTGGHARQQLLDSWKVPWAAPQPIGGQCPLHGTVENYAAARQTVVFVRHPVYWLVSMWAYHQNGIPRQRNWLDRILPYAELSELWDADWEQYVRNVTEAAGIVGRIFEQYTTAGVKVFRMEDSIPLLPWVNASPTTRRGNTSRESLAQLAESEADTMRKYGYAT